jgi:hypothetical protein
VALPGVAVAVKVGVGLKVGVWVAVGTPPSGVLVAVRVLVAVAVGPAAVLVAVAVMVGVALMVGEKWPSRSAPARRPILELVLVVLRGSGARLPATPVQEVFLSCTTTCGSCDRGG